VHPASARCRPQSSQKEGFLGIVLEQPAAFEHPESFEQSSSGSFVRRSYHFRPLRPSVVLRNYHLLRNGISFHKEKIRISKLIPSLISNFLPRSGCSESAIAAAFASGVSKSTYANLHIYIIH